MIEASPLSIRGALALLIAAWGSSAALITGNPARADVVFTYSQVREEIDREGARDRQERGREIWTGRNAEGVRSVRIDMPTEDGPGESRLFSKSRDRLVLLRHDDQTWEALPTSATLETIAPEAIRPYVAEAIASSTVEVELEPMGSTRQVGAWTCQETGLTVTTRRRVVKGKACATAEIDIDDTVYRRAEEIWYSFDPSAGLPSSWLRIEGWMVELGADYSRSQGGKVVLRQTLESVEEVPDDPSRFQIPEGYREIPLDTTRWMSMTRPE